MTSSSEFDEAFEPDLPLFGKEFSFVDRSSDTRCSMRVLERLALTLGVPVEAFFAEHARIAPTDRANVEDVEELTRAFVAITDPIMRRYCLDVVRAAGIEQQSCSQAAASA